MMKKKIILVTALSALALLLAVVIFTGISIWNYGQADEKRQADVAIVLGAASTDDGVSPVFRERINHGIWLYNNGYVEYIIFTGGIGEGNTLSEAHMAKQYAITQGVPESVIYIEERSAITEENLEYARQIMDEQGFETALIVSDPLHMKRAMLMAADYGIEAYSSPTPTSMYRSLKTKLPFLVREDVLYIGYCIVRVFR